MILLLLDPVICCAVFSRKVKLLKYLPLWVCELILVEYSLCYGGNDLADGQCRWLRADSSIRPSDPGKTGMSTRRQNSPHWLPSHSQASVSALFYPSQRLDSRAQLHTQHYSPWSDSGPACMMSVVCFLAYSSWSGFSRCPKSLSSVLSPLNLSWFPMFFSILSSSQPIQIYLFHFHLMSHCGGLGLRLRPAMEWGPRTTA